MFKFSEHGFSCQLRFSKEAVCTNEGILARNSLLGMMQYAFSHGITSVRLDKQTRLDNRTTFTFMYIFYPVLNVPQGPLSHSVKSGLWKCCIPSLLKL